jgi:uncharacterized protein (UPF0264 family)
MSEPGHDWRRGLLVSVRSAAEARLAVAGGAGIIDVKEPSRGPLGRADAAVIAAVAVAVGGTPLTLALGELADGVERVLAALVDVERLLPGGCPRPRAVKAGPAGMTLTAWSTAFAAVIGGLPAGIEPVAVAYADWGRAAAPRPSELVAAAADAGARTLLVDTFDKRGPGLVAMLGQAGIATLLAAATGHGLAVALAGRLTAADVAAAFALGADVVGVRSAACGGDRLGRVAIDRVRRLATLASRCDSRERSTPPVEFRVPGDGTDGPDRSSRSASARPD